MNLLAVLLVFIPFSLCVRIHVASTDWDISGRHQVTVSWSGFFTTYNHLVMKRVSDKNEIIEDTANWWKMSDKTVKNKETNKYQRVLSDINISSLSVGRYELFAARDGTVDRPSERVFINVINKGNNGGNGGEDSYVQANVEVFIGEQSTARDVTVNDELVLITRSQQPLQLTRIVLTNQNHPRNEESWRLTDANTFHYKQDLEAFEMKAGIVLQGLTPGVYVLSFLQNENQVYPSNGLVIKAVDFSPVKPLFEVPSSPAIYYKNFLLRSQEVNVNPDTELADAFEEYFERNDPTTKVSLQGVPIDIDAGLKSLMKETMIGEDVIDAVLSQWIESSPATIRESFVYIPAALKQGVESIPRTRDYFRRHGRLEQKRFFLFPYNTGVEGHWILLIFDKAENKFMVVDSVLDNTAFGKRRYAGTIAIFGHILIDVIGLSSHDVNHLGRVMMSRSDHHRSYEFYPPSVDYWHGVERQTTRNSCGIFVLVNALTIMNSAQATIDSSYSGLDVLRAKTLVGFRQNHVELIRKILFVAYNLRCQNAPGPFPECIGGTNFASTFLRS
jgi:hypothetical protein